MTLATAFAGDPVIRWLMPTPGRDARMFRALAAHLHAAPGCADVALENGGVVGAALWDPPGHRVSLGQAMIGLSRLLAAMRWSGFRRGATLERAFTNARPAESVWYLAQLGAATPGQGVGSALLEPALRASAGRPIWRAAIGETCRCTSASGSRRLRRSHFLMGRLSGRCCAANRFSPQGSWPGSRAQCRRRSEMRRLIRSFETRDSDSYPRRP